MSPSIHRIEPANVEILRNVDPECFDEPIDLDRARACVSSPDAMLAVAVVDGEVVGQCLAAIHRHPDKDTELYIDDLAVSPRFQRRGLARQLVAACRAWGVTRGAAVVWVATEPDNDAANALYRALDMTVRTAHVFEANEAAAPRSDAD